MEGIKCGTGQDASYFSMTRNPSPQISPLPLCSPSSQLPPAPTTATEARNTGDLHPRPAPSHQRPQSVLSISCPVPPLGPTATTFVQTASTSHSTCFRQILAGQQPSGLSFPHPSSGHPPHSWNSECLKDGNLIVLFL